ncbi:MAG: O-antigen ligase family protein [Candidatus Cybelea sp.]
MEIVRGPRALPQLVLAAAASLTAIAALALLVFGVSPAGVGLAALVIAPLALYIAQARPLDFPLGLYVLLIPFDNLLSAGSFGTLTKLLGIATGIFLLVWIVRRHRLALAGAPVVVLLALVVWMLASAFWAIDQTAALKIMPTYAGLMLLYAGLTMMPISPSQFRRLLFLVVVGGVCAALYGIHAFYNDPALTQNSAARFIVQAGQNSIDPNHFADALLFPVAIVTMWGLRSARLLAKAACMAGLAVLVLAILFSGSREGVTGLLLIIGYYLWRSRYRFQVLIALSGMLVIASAAPSSLWQRFSTVLQTGGSGRTSIWAVAIEAAKHRFLQGYGIGNFTGAYDLFYLTVHQPYPYGWESPAHNLVMHYMVELGAVGLALVAGFFAAQFLSLRGIGRGNDLYDDRIVLEASLLAIAAVSLTIDLFTYKYAWLVFSMVALLHNAAKGVQRSAVIRDTTSSMMQARSARDETAALPDSPSLRNAALSSRAS